MSGNSDSVSQRLALFERLACLPEFQFEQVLFSLKPPSGNVPSAKARQRDRVADLLEWVESPIGCGLDQVEVVYSQVVNYQLSLNPNLKPGSPFPRVRLPENYVARPDALNAVKEKLLAEDERTLVVSAISGLGGLGKSVLATALVMDSEVQVRFSDGILWVTLGQKPDLQTMLGDWIRQLDKSREAFSANTLESASRYLHNLLAEKQMLLVVDDVWNAAHAEWFRVGGAGCRVLVTTREAQIEGAECYPLDLMTEAEAVDLVRRKLDRQWQTQQEEEVKAFARVLGYLPLALDLAANQVKDGFTWTELQSEFEVERQAVALEVLDASEAWERLDEEHQRQYSLRACFSLSLRRLKPEQLRKFVWLGVLPEDVNLSVQVAAVLWDVRPIKAKQGLIDLRRRSFLTDGVATLEGESTYRVHDLMHDMARNLVEDGALEIQNLKSKIQNLPLAHRQFLERYRARAIDQRWDRLPNDGYIHRHLTWHMEQAGWADEVHALIAMSDNQGRNAWFEACDRIGQPSIFVEDVTRGWALADKGYASGAARSIVLQCRCALITATLNSLAANLPIGMMSEFVKQKFWTIEQAWAYVEQMQDEQKLAGAIQLLSPYLSKPLFQVALAAARGLQEESRRADVLSALAQVDGAYFTEALEAARGIQEESRRASVLRDLAQVDGANFVVVLAAAQEIQEESRRADVLRDLAQVDGANFVVVLAAAQEIQEESRRADVLSVLAQVDGADFAAVWEAARGIQSKYSRALVLRALAQVDGAYFTEALETARGIQDEYSRALVLRALAQVDGADFAAVLEAARRIQYESSRALVLRALAQVDGANFAAVLEAARGIHSEYSRASVLSALAQVDRAYFTEALAAARGIESESRRADVLSALAQVNGANFTAVLAAARGLQDESSRADVLSMLAQVDRADFSAVLEAAQGIESEYSRALVLSALAQVDGADFSAVLEAVRRIQYEYSRALVLSALAQVDGANFTAVLAAARGLQDESSRASVLSALAQVDRAYFTEALEVARGLRDESSRALVLSALAQVDRAYFTEALEVARGLQDESSRALVLRALAQVDGANFSAVLAAARGLRDESSRALVLRALAQVDGANFSAVLELARGLQDESSRALVLRALAQVDGAHFTAVLAAARGIQYEYSRASVLRVLAQIDGANFSAVLAAARGLQDEYSRALVLSALAQVDEAYFTEALEVARGLQDESSRTLVLRVLTQVDGADFSAVLAAARGIESESRRALVLSALAQVNEAYFTEALAAARGIEPESRRALVLSALAQVNGPHFTAVLAAARGIQSESRRASVLHELAKHIPQEFLSILWKEISAFKRKPAGAKFLSQSLPCFLVTSLLHSNWQSILHLLACRQRSDLMQDLVTLYPVIRDLGGETAMRGVVDAMREVCSQWK